MKHPNGILLLAVVSILISLSCNRGDNTKNAASGDASVKEQINCPVMGNPVNKSVYTDYKGNRIYFCCPPCVDTFKKDPEKYMQKLKADRVQPATVPR